VPFFLVCRLFFVLVLVFYQHLVTFQIHLVTLIACTQVMYASMLHYKNRLDSIIEFMNQIAAYVACVMLYLMTDYVESNEVSYFYGWGLIGLVAVFVGLNILIQLGVIAR
jgi:hypothetical protein